MRERLPASGLVLVCGLIAAVPIFVAAGHAIAVRWVPLSDLGYTAVKSFDVFTGRSPLVGQWSSGASAAADHLTYSPGPLLFWVLAVPTRWLGQSAPAVAAGVVNVAAVVGSVVLAHRRGGMPLAIATAIAIPLMLASLPAEARSDPWNSSAPLMPLVLLFFVCWSLACGEYRLLPLAVFVASFEVQSHLTYSAPVVLMLGVGLVGLALTRPREKGELRPWILGALVVGLICWSAPLIDQAVHRPGNLVLLGRAATTSVPTLGLKAGWHAMAHTIGIVPWWLQGPRSALEWIADVGTGVGALATISTLAILGALVALVVLGWRRGRPDIRAAGALGLALAAAVALDAASTPKDQVATISYTLRWTSPAGMCVWLSLGWALVQLAPRRERLPRLGTAGALAGTGVAAAIAIAVAVDAKPQEQPYRPQRELNRLVVAALPRDGRTQVEAADFSALSFQSGLVYWLRHEGRDVVAPDMLKPLGPDYATGPHDRVVRIQVQSAGAAQPPPGRVIASLPYHEAFASDPNKVVSATLQPGSN
jgi:hypothetical protein